MSKSPICRPTLTLILFCFLLIPFYSTAQKRIIPQFDFTQFDSLVNVTVSGIRANDSTSLVTAYIYWSIGSCMAPSGRYASCDNYFEIYFFFSNGSNKCYILKLDNFGYFKKRKCRRREIQDFLLRYTAAMKQEDLLPKTDTSYDDKGDIVIRRSWYDHQLESKVRIFAPGDTLQYNYPESYSKNKYNLQTYRVRFLNLLEQERTGYNRKKSKRLSVVWEKDAADDTAESR